MSAVDVSDDRNPVLHSNKKKSVSRIPSPEWNLLFFSKRTVQFFFQQVKFPSTEERVLRAFHSPPNNSYQNKRILVKTVSHTWPVNWNEGDCLYFYSLLSFSVICKKL